MRGLELAVNRGGAVMPEGPVPPLSNRVQRFDRRVLADLAGDELVDRHRRRAHALVADVLGAGEDVHLVLVPAARETALVVAGVGQVRDDRRLVADRLEGPEDRWQLGQRADLGRDPVFRQRPLRVIPDAEADRRLGRLRPPAAAGPSLRGTAAPGSRPAPST